jgi:hypothetical protein
MSIDTMGKRPRRLVSYSSADLVSPAFTATDRFVRIDGSTACTMPLSQTAGSQAMVRDGSPLHKMKTFKDGHLSRWCEGEYRVG